MNIHRKTILVALSELEYLDEWLSLCQRETAAGGVLSLRGMVTVEEGISLSEGAVQARAWREAFAALEQAGSIASDGAAVYVDYHPMTRVIEHLQNQPADLLLVQWRGPVQMTGGLSTDDILNRAPCDTVLLHGQGWQVGGPALLSLRGGPNLTLGIQTAKLLAPGAAITLFHATPNPQQAPDLEIVMRSERQISRAVTAVTDIAEGILREANGHRIIIMGAGLRKPETPQTDVSIVQDVYTQTSLPIALVRAWRPEIVSFHVPYANLYRVDDLSTRVDRWFAENSFNSAEFADLHALAALKEKQGVTISIGLPALNEEETVGKVITTLRTSLMTQVPLVDEIVLIDSNSQDRTVEMAQALGVPVYRHPDILPEMGSHRGKGEALWKSLHVLRGDIIAWVDTDITNIHPRFIYGLIGPLLKYPRVQYVKGFYQRPIKVGDKTQAYGGGRVTELVARPLLNMFYPELSGIIQPLSGEYAGRRAALEQVPFFSGYGVETGLLIDLHHRFGLQAIAQTDLEVRVHHNQSLVNLSKMSFAILQVFMARLEQHHGLSLLEHANRSMKLVIQEPDRFALDIQAIIDAERPPMLEVGAYRLRHARAAL
jgi:glucosyl-3-phosphoglycerate synthase